MTVTVTDDFTTLQSCDAVGNIGPYNGNVKAPTADTGFKVEGSAALAGIIDGTTGLMGYSDGTSRAAGFYEGKHFLVWAAQGGAIPNTAANGGWRVIGSQTAYPGNQDPADSTEWKVAGPDDGRALAVRFSYKHFCLNLARPPDYVIGTVWRVATAVANGIGYVCNTISAENETGKFYIDELKEGTGITVVAGTTGNPGVSAEIATDDDNIGRGTFLDVSGAYLIMGRLTLGDDGTLDSYFRDKNEIWVFNNQPYRASFNHIEFVGGTGTNEVSFGAEVGTGVAAVGSGGNSFTSANLPFSVTAEDSGVTANLLGCTLINPIAKVEDFFLSCQQEDNSVSSFVDQTLECADDEGTLYPSGSANDLPFFPTTEGVNDACYFGYDVPFTEMVVDVTTAGSTDGVVVWEYYNGTSWVSLPELTDSTNGLETAARNTVEWVLPTDWATTTINSLGPYYYVRVRITTVFGTNPLGDQAQPKVGGRVKWEQANAKALSCLFLGMDVISLRNSAILRKCAISDSVASAKEGAVDLGSSDPATDTFRDNQIQNCAAGVLLKGTSTGTTTYNFRNITFDGNTNDVRVDFPSTATVVINILEGGDTPTIDNVNGSTVNVVNAKVVKVTAIDASTLAVIQNVRILLEADTGGDLPVAETVTITRSGTTATVSHTAHGLTAGEKVSIRRADQQEYNGVFIVATVVDANSYTYTVSGSPATPATGTITATGVLVSGLTNASGVVENTGWPFTSDQPVKGIARKSTVSPKYKASPLTGTVTVDGYDQNTFLVSDE